MYYMTENILMLNKNLQIIYKIILKYEFNNGEGYFVLFTRIIV